MATKLKNLKITNVDLVDEGANPDAFIDLQKNKDKGDRRKPRDEPESWDGIINYIAESLSKAFQKEASNAQGEVAKDAKTFSEAIGDRQKETIEKDIWNLCAALTESLRSILFDEDLDGEKMKKAMQESISDFSETAMNAVTQWAGGNPVGIVFKGREVSRQQRRTEESEPGKVTEMIGKTGQGYEGETAESQTKGEVTDMRIDKSKMTPAEKAMLEEFEKRYGIADENQEAGGEGATESGTVEKKALPEAGKATDPPAQGAAAPEGVVAKTATALSPDKTDSGGDDVYKGLHPAVRTELEALRKFREEAEEKELRRIAGKYAVIGKKEDELVPMLKSMKAAGGSAYDDMIALLDHSVEVFEKSGVFGEIGKSGNGSLQKGGVVKEVETKALELMKSKNGINMAQAIDQILMEDAELAKRYEEED